MSPKILILGATGGIGGAVTKAMLSRGWQVSALVRDPNKAASKWRGAAPHWIAGDAMRRADVVRAAEGASAILHGVNPPRYRNWETLVLPMLDDSIAAARAAGGVRIVLPGTIYNYDATTTPLINEHTPQNGRGKKGLLRIAMEQRLAQAAPEVPSLIVRAGDFFGPGAGQGWFAQALAKPPLKAITYPGRAGCGHSWAYLPDLAEAMAQLLDREPRLLPAEILQFEGFWDSDGKGMIDAIRRVARQPKLAVKALPWWLFRLLALGGGFAKEVMEVRPYWRNPVRLDNTRLVALLGSEPRTALDVAVATAMAG
jgi:nucleoside-diphosphate-sugar epimerase